MWHNKVPFCVTELFSRGQFMKKMASEETQLNVFDLFIVKKFQLLLTKLSFKDTVNSKPHVRER